MYLTFNDGQKSCFDELDNAVQLKLPKIFFVDAVGGTGKTYLFNALLSKWHSERKIAPSVAGSGIAAILLQGGKTPHATFKIPLDCHSTTSCTVTKRSATGRMLFLADVILWDEGPMSSKDVIGSVNRLLKNLTGNMNTPFGGKTVIFGGDFRQTVPIVPHQGRSDIVSKTIFRSPWWPSTKVLKLHINKRVRQNGDTPEARRFAQFLLDVGEGALPFHPEIGQNMVCIPDEYIFQSDSLHEFIKWCYPDIDSTTGSINVAERALLAAKNIHVDELNNEAIDMMHGQTLCFESADCVHASEEDSAGFSLLSISIFLHALDFHLTNLVLKAVYARCLHVQSMNGRLITHWMRSMDTKN